jgi:hypothetical protein
MCKKQMYGVTLNEQSDFPVQLCPGFLYQYCDHLVIFTFCPVVTKITCPSPQCSYLGAVTPNLGNAGNIGHPIMGNTQSWDLYHRSTGNLTATINSLKLLDIELNCNSKPK